MPTPDQFTTISLTVESGIARLRLNRPEAANAVNATMAAELRRAATDLRWDRSVRAVLLSGEGRVFCGGGDLGEFLAQGDRLPGHLTAITTDLHTALSLFATMDAPVIAAVAGSAGGAGFSLVAGSDLVLAARRAKFTLGYTAVGLTPDGGSSFNLARVVGLRRAMELVLTNRVLTAEEAESWGLVNRVVDDDALDREADELARLIATGATASLGVAKRLVTAGAAASLIEALARESDAISEASSSVDAQEGMTAFLAKRPPHFVGR